MWPTWGEPPLTFWIVAVAAALIAAAFVARPLFAREEEAAPRAAHDAQVFRDQLKELERDVARGVVSPEDAETTRIDISRRLLAADAESREIGAGARTAPRGVSRAAAALLILAAPAGAALLYAEVGAPGAEDAPFAQRGDEGRPSQEEAERMLAGREAPPPADGAAAAEFTSLVKQLEARLAEAPNDQQGVFLYARSLMNLGRFADAWPQFGKLIELRRGKVEADIYAGYAEGMILAAGGYVSPEAETALLETLKREPTNPSARYYVGRLHAQQGELKLAEAIWGKLLAESEPTAPWVPAIRAEMAELGLAPVGADGLPGPTLDEMKAAGSLPPQDREQMVADMVGRLAERLEAEGGTVAEWQRLIRSYSVLGRNGDARDALEKARAAFANDPAALSALERGDAMSRVEGQPGGPAAGGGFQLPPAAGGGGLPGPTAEDMAAAGEMSAGDRQAMIQGMVARLRERLETEGGSPDEWLRLISSLRVLGRGEDAASAYESARAAFAGDPQALSVLEAAVEGAPRAIANAPAAAPAPASSAPAPSAGDQRGPTREDVEAARDMTPADRQEMIRGMVAQLHDRLRDEGRAADVNEWGKLMRSYGVLGQGDAVVDAYEEARNIYADDAISLAYLKEAALLAGARFN